MKSEFYGILLILNVIIYINSKIGGNIMVEYKYVSIDSEKLIGSTFTEHRNIIDEYAKQGYRFVGYIPIEMTNYGKYKIIDLIFEKEK